MVLRSGPLRDCKQRHCGGDIPRRFDHDQFGHVDRDPVAPLRGRSRSPAGRAPGHDVCASRATIRRNMAPAAIATVINTSSKASPRAYLKADKAQ
jgi:hypothetical protein